MTLCLIRHGQTQGNLEGRYIGCRSDEGLCPSGICTIQNNTYPAVRRVFVSPMRRCIETARLIWPHIEPQVVSDFRECDFGDFEGKNYRELNGNAAYQAWIDSGGEKAFPNGESRAVFADRCVRAFEALNVFANSADTALVVHGGTIMAIMEHCARPRGHYFDFQVKCGEGYLLSQDGTYEPLIRK